MLNIQPDILLDVMDYACEMQHYVGQGLVTDLTCYMYIMHLQRHTYRYVYSFNIGAVPVVHATS